MACRRRRYCFPSLHAVDRRLILPVRPAGTASVSRDRFLLIFNENSNTVGPRKASLAGMTDG